MNPSLDPRPAPVQASPLGQTIALPAEPAARARTGQGRFQKTMGPLLQNPKVLVGAVILLAFTLVAILAPVIAPGDPGDIVARRHLAPSGEHWFGTTGGGQDVFAQTIWGARLSLSIGVAVGLVTTAVGALIGMSAGYFGGRVDDVLSMAMNVFLIIPSVPLLVVLSAFLGSGSPAYFIFVLGLTGWAWPARVLRSQTLSLREKDFVSAAEISGERSFRIIFQDILPNMTSIAVAGMFGSVIYAIGALTALEFLGLGNPSVVSWGTNLYWAANNGALLTGAWWTVLPAGICVAIVAFAFAMVNYAVDEVTNPRLRAERETRHVLGRTHRAIRGSRATPVLRDQPAG